MAAIDQLQADGKKAKDRPMQIHDLLEDFSSLLDEIDDNVDMYASHKADMRKGLRLLIEADSEWQLKLRRLKEQSPPEELDQYSFVLANATDAVNDSGDDAREELQEQNELAKAKEADQDLFGAARLRMRAKYKGPPNFPLWRPFPVVCCNSNVRD